MLLEILNQQKNTTGLQKPFFRENEQAKGTNPRDFGQNYEVRWLLNYKILGILEL